MARRLKTYKALKISNLRHPNSSKKVLGFLQKQPRIAPTETPKKPQNSKEHR